MVGIMADEAEEKVSKFYNTVGWQTVEGEITEDARRWADLRKYAKEYLVKCQLRVLRHIPEKGENILDMASGPIQHEAYIEYSRNFKKRYCVDLSLAALESAKNKIGDHGVFLNGSIFDIPLKENFFDCTISLHTIYHIDKDKQEMAVRKLINVTKPGKPVIIVYRNPKAFDVCLAKPLFYVIRKVKCILKKTDKIKEKDDIDLYFYAHPIMWWNRFSDISSVKVYPWRSFRAEVQRRLIPNNKLGKKIFDILFNLEDRFPNYFVKHFSYPMIVLTKNNA